MSLTKVSYSLVTGAPFNVLDYGADPTGASDSRAACQAAITACRSAGGGVVYFPNGTYLINSVAGPDGTGNGLVIPYVSSNGTSQRVRLVGESRSTVLKAGSTSMYVVRFSDSNGGVENLSIDGSNLSGVIGLGVVPENLNQTTELVFQLYNVFRNLYILNCTEGVVLRCGPDVATADSGCWYNEFSAMHIYSCIRGIWLRDCPVGSSPVNRNYFTDIRIGQNMNTGIQIDDGGTNVFTQVHIEGVVSGTSPNAVPTAVKIKQTGASTGDNNYNVFVGCMFEANTRTIDNDNAYTEFFGCGVASPGTSLFSKYPRIFINSDPSIIPNFMPGITYQDNSQVAGVENQTIYLQNGRLQFPASQNASTDPNVLDDYEEGSWTPGLAATSMAGQTYEYQLGRYVKIGKSVMFWGDVKLSGYSDPGSNFLRVTGLPFSAASASSPPATSVAMSYFDLTGGTVGRTPRGVIGQGTTECSFIEQDADGAPLAIGMSGTRLTTSSRFIISGVYQTAS